jgi:hypothetical protein
MKNITFKTSLSSLEDNKVPDKNGVAPKKKYRENGPLKRLVCAELLGEHFFHARVIEGREVGRKLFIWYKNVPKEWAEEV